MDTNAGVRWPGFFLAASRVGAEADAVKRKQARARGANRYCPDCGRWLVRIHDDGSFDLAAEASMDCDRTSFIGSVPPDEVLIIGATCLRCNP